VAVDRAVGVNHGERRQRRDAVGANRRSWM